MFEQVHNNEAGDIPATGETGAGEVYNIPSEFAERGWASNAPEFKTQEDYVGWITKQHDNQQEFIGGKVDKLVEEQGYTKMPDFSNLEQSKEFFSKIAPKDISDYKLAEQFGSDEKFKMADTAIEHFGNTFKENGILPEQANKIVESFKAYEQKQIEELYNPDDLKSRMKSLFGENIEQAKVPIDNMLKELLSEEDIKAVTEKMPNQAIEVMFKLAKGLHGKYGYKESSTGANLPETSVLSLSQSEKDEKYNEVHQKIIALSKTNHKQSDKDALVKELQLYI